MTAAVLDAMFGQSRQHRSRIAASAADLARARIRFPDIRPARGPSHVAFAAVRAGRAMLPLQHLARRFEVLRRRRYQSRRSIRLRGDARPIQPVQPRNCAQRRQLRVTRPGAKSEDRTGQEIDSGGHQCTPAPLRSCESRRQLQPRQTAGARHRAIAQHPGRRRPDCPTLTAASAIARRAKRCISPRARTASTVAARNRRPVR